MGGVLAVGAAELWIIVAGVVGGGVVAATAMLVSRMMTVLMWLQMLLQLFLTTIGVAGHGYLTHGKHVAHGTSG